MAVPIVVRVESGQLTPLATTITLAPGAPGVINVDFAMTSRSLKLRLRWHHPPGHHLEHHPVRPLRLLVGGVVKGSHHPRVRLRARATLVKARVATTLMPLQQEHHLLHPEQKLPRKH